MKVIRVQLDVGLVFEFMIVVVLLKKYIIIINIRT